MRILTVRQPFASAIVDLGKSPENRSTEWAYVGPLAIHAGAAKHDDVRAGELDAMLSDPRFGDRLMAGNLPSSAIVGVVRLDGAHRASDDCCPGNAWARREPGTVHLHLTRPVAFLAPIVDVKGGLGLWRPGDSLERRIRVAWELAAAAQRIDNVRGLAREAHL